MIEEIGKDAYKISGDCNVYLITKPVPLVIDTGQPAEREKIKTIIQKIVSLDKIKVVILTHLHFDHSGNVNLFPNAKFYCSKEEIEDMKDNPSQFFLEKCLKKSKKSY